MGGTGYTIGPPLNTPPPAAPPAPSSDGGYTIGPPPSAAATPAPSQPPSMLQGVAHLLTDPAAGAGAGVAQSLAGIARPIESVVGATSHPVSGALQKAAGVDTGPGGTMGKFAEGVGEFAGGGELLKGAEGLLSLAERYPQLMAMVEKFPKASRILLSAAKGGAVGGAQGAVKASGAGESPSDVAASAEKEAAGTAVLSGAGEGLGELFKRAPAAEAEAAQEVDAVEKGRKQLLRSAPAGMTPKTLDNIDMLEKTGHMAEIAKSKPTSYVDAYKATNEHMSDFFDRTVKPALERQGDVGMSLQPVADAVSALHNPAIESVLPESMKAIDKSVERFAGKEIPIKDAYQLLVDFNAMTRNLAKMAPADQAAAENQAAAVAALSTATDALRSNLYDTLNTLGEHGIPDAQRQYGALAGFRDLMGKNIVRAEKADAAIPTYMEGLLKLVTQHPVYTGVAAGGMTAGMLTHPAETAAGAVGVAIADLIKTAMTKAGTPNALLAKAFENYADGPGLGEVTTRGPAGARTWTVDPNALASGRRMLPAGTPEAPESATPAAQSPITERTANGSIATPVPEGSPGTGPSGTIPNQGPVPFTRLLGPGEGESGPHAMPPSPLAPGAGSEPTPTGGARGYTSEPQPASAAASQPIRVSRALPTPATQVVFDDIDNGKNMIENTIREYGHELAPDDLEKLQNSLPKFDALKQAVSFVSERYPNLFSLAKIKIDPWTNFSGYNPEQGTVTIGIRNVREAKDMGSPVDTFTYMLTHELEHAREYRQFVRSGKGVGFDAFQQSFGDVPGAAHEAQPSEVRAVRAGETATKRLQSQTKGGTSVIIRDPKTGEEREVLISPSQK